MMPHFKNQINKSIINQINQKNNHEKPNFNFRNCFNIIII